MKTLPLHSLVLIVGPNIQENNEVAQRHFLEYEIINTVDLVQELTGGSQGLSADDSLVLREAHRRAAVKLSLGERVVINATNLLRKDRLSAAQIAFYHGAPVYYIVCAKEHDQEDESIQAADKMLELFRANEREILYGDNIANVVDTRIEGLDVVSKFPGNASPEVALKWIADRYNGICVVPDVHAMLQSFKQAIDWASRRNLFLVLLGDVIDYGPQSVECIYLVYDLLMRSRAIMVIGNHERKIERWLAQQRKLMHDPHAKSTIKLSDANKATTTVIESMITNERSIFENRFKAVMAHARHHWLLGHDCLVVHGAAEPEMFNHTSPRLTGKLESRALFGEIDGVNPQMPNGYPNRVYNWVNRVPAGKTVIVGHDIRSTIKPLRSEGSLGGIVYFMDTGSGKGGRLTTADLLFKDGKLEVQNFTVH
jgi:predicted kinase